MKEYSAGRELMDENGGDDRPADVYGVVAPDPPRHMASFAITPMLIEQALTIPAGHEIVGAEWDFASRTIRLYIEGPELPEVERGMRVPDISPTVTVSLNEEGRRCHTWHWDI